MEVVGGGGGGGGVVAMCNGSGFSKSKTVMELRWATRHSSKNPKLRNIPMYVSINPSDVNPHELRDLFSKCNYSCHRSPFVDSGTANGGVVLETFDVDKLRIALSHSTVVVSVFCNSRYLSNNEKQKGLVVEERNENDRSSWMALGDLLQTAMMIPSPSNGQLVGFGRAVSDLGLTASIYDVTVVPTFRRMGIGKMIVKRIIRMLTSKDVYDISVLCSPNERLFFEACGFGDDMLGSTTMIYSRTLSP